MLVSDTLSRSYLNNIKSEFDETTLIRYVHLIVLNLLMSQSRLGQFCLEHKTTKFCKPLFVILFMVGQKTVKYRKRYFFITPTSVELRTMKLLISRSDLRAEFSLGFPEINLRYSLRESNNRDMLP